MKLVLIRGVIWGRKGKIAAREAAMARDARRQLERLKERKAA
jgi:hypothetical protein